jgi:hypothetical protein
MTVRQLHMRNAELSTRLKRKTTEAKKNRKKENPSDQRITRYAKLFGVMNEPFVDKMALLAPRPIVDSTDPDRYQSDLSKIQGVTAELYETLPEDMHGELQRDTHFQSMVSAPLS